MKKYSNIILAGLIIILIALSLRLNNRKPEVVPEAVVAGTTVDSKACYLYEQEINLSVGEGEENLAQVNREYLEFAYTGEQTIEGTHNIIPAESDSNRANFIGVTDGEYINVIATAQAEGETWQEQRVYRVEGNNLYVGYQPVYVPKYQDENGVYLFEDINKLVFDTEEFFLEKVSCDDVDSTQL